MQPDFLITLTHGAGVDRHGGGGGGGVVQAGGAGVQSGAGRTTFETHEHGLLFCVKRSVLHPIHGIANPCEW